MNTRTTKAKRFTTRFVFASAAAAAMSVGVIASATPVDKGTADAIQVADKTDDVRARRPELPREWRWERRAQNFDSMFRQK